MGLIHYRYLQVLKSIDSGERTKGAIINANKVKGEWHKLTRTSSCK